MRYTPSDGIRGWLQGRAKRLACYGAGSIEIAGSVLTLRGWHRTWLGVPAEIEILVPASGIRNVARDCARVHGECKIGRHWRTVEFTGSSEAEATAVCSLLPSTTTTGFATAWEELRDFNRALGALPERAWITESLVATNVVLFIVVAVTSKTVIFIDSMQLTRWGANYGLLTTHGEWWRMLSATFLHGGMIHLAFNMWALWSVGRLTERLYGSWTYLAVYLGAGVLASMVSTAWNPALISIGASGAIFGVIGAFLAYLAHKRTHVPMVILRAHRASTLFFVAFNLIAGALSANVDNAAHVGGLVSGFLIGWLLASPMDVARTAVALIPRATAALALVAALLTIGVSRTTARDPDTAGPYEFWRANKWYLPQESSNLRLWQQLAISDQAGLISEHELKERFEADILPFWESAAKRLHHAQTPRMDVDPLFSDLVLEFVTLRRDWARSIIAQSRRRDNDNDATPVDFAREANLLQARMDRGHARYQLDHGPRGVRGAFVNSFRTLSSKLRWKCVEAPKARGMSPGTGDAVSDGPSARQAAGCEAQQLFVTGDYAALDARLSSSAAQLADLPDGSSTYAGAVAGLDDLFDYGGYDVTEALERLSDWHRVAPASILPSLFEALMYRQWAWTVRGGGYAETVTAQAWQVFAYRNEMAVATLEEVREQAATNPLWYVLSMETALDNSIETENIRDMFNAGVARFPDYQPLYRAMLRTLMPRWQGSKETVAQFIEDVSAASPQPNETYARLYWIYSSLEGDEENIFEYGRVDWTRSDTGFRALLQRQAQSDYLLNAYANLACQQGDEAIYERLRDRLDGHLSAAAWSSKRTVESCDRKFDG